MATLNNIQVIPEYNLILKFHDSRPPSDLIVTRIANGLFEARRIMGIARARLITAINGGSRSSLVEKIIQYHFGIDLTQDLPPNTPTNQITNTLQHTHEGLNGVVTISDVFSEFYWNKYESDRKLKTDKKFGTHTGTHRAGTSPGEEGYVKPKQNVQANVAHVDSMGSIHVEFALAANYPRSQMARIIIHEATHKYAATKDHAYTLPKVFYEDLTVAQRAENADCYAYAAISLLAGVLIKSHDDCFKILPQYGAPQRESIDISLTKIFSSLFKSLFKR